MSLFISGFCACLALYWFQTGVWPLGVLMVILSLCGIQFSRKGNVNG